MYLKHLENSRGFTISDPRTGGFLWASEEIVREFITLGKVIPFGSKRCISALHWIGEPMRALLTAEEQLDKGSRGGPTRYSHNRDTPDNPENVWTLIRLGGKPYQRVFFAVVTSCWKAA